MQLSSQDTWLNAFEFADVASNYLTVVDDIVVFATLVDEQEVVIHIVLLLVTIGANHHVEGDVIRIVLVILKIVKLYFGVLHPILGLLEFSIIHLLQVLEFFVDVL